MTFYEIWRTYSWVPSLTTQLQLNFRLSLCDKYCTLSWDVLQNWNKRLLVEWWKLDHSIVAAISQWRCRLCLSQDSSQWTFKAHFVMGFVVQCVQLMLSKFLHLWFFIILFVAKMWLVWTVLPSIGRDVTRLGGPSPPQRTSQPPQTGRVIGLFCMAVLDIMLL